MYGLLYGLNQKKALEIISVKAKVKLKSAVTAMLFSSTKTLFQYQYCFQRYQLKIFGVTLLYLR